LAAVILLVATGLAATAPAAAAQDDVVTVTVTLVDRNGDPVGGADLTATWDDGSTEATTASNGKAFLDVPADAEVTVEVDHETYVRNHPYEFTAEPDGEETVTVAESGTLSVDAVQEDDPVENAQVIVRQDGRIVVSDETDGDGTVRTDRIEQGNYSVTVLKDGFYRVRKTVTVDGDVTEDFEMERGSVTVTFNVTDDHYGEPEGVENAQVSVEGIGTVNTLSNGEATVTVPVNTEISITVTKEGHEQQRLTAEIEESDTTIDASITRVPQLTLEVDNERVVVGEDVGVTVRDEYGDPVGGATVYLDGEAAGETDARGRLRVDVESEGEHELTAETADLSTDPVDIEGIAEAEEETPTETATATTTEDELPEGVPDEVKTVRDEVPGFGTVTALLALVAAALIAGRRS